MKPFKRHLKLFKETFLISAFTFGGGYVIVPLLKKKFIDELHWIDEEEMLDLIAIAQSSPGPIAVNTAIMIGHKLSGFKGALVATVGTSLPPLIIITIISMFYEAFKQNVVVSWMMTGMQAAVAAIILNVCFTMFHHLIIKDKWLNITLFALVFILSFVLKVNVIFIIIGAGLIGIALMFWNRGGQRELA